MPVPEMVAHKLYSRSWPSCSLVEEYSWRSLAHCILESNPGPRSTNFCVCSSGAKYLQSISNPTIPSQQCSAMLQTYLPWSLCRRVLEASLSTLLSHPALWRRTRQLGSWWRCSCDNPLIPSLTGWHLLVPPHWLLWADVLLVLGNAERLGHGVGCGVEVHGHLSRLLRVGGHVQLSWLLPLQQQGGVGWGHLVFPVSFFPGGASIKPHKPKTVTADDGTEGTAEWNYK